MSWLENFLGILRRDTPITSLDDVEFNNNFIKYFYYRWCHTHFILNRFWIFHCSWLRQWILCVKNSPSEASRWPVIASWTVSSPLINPGFCLLVPSNLSENLFSIELEILIRKFSSVFTSGKEDIFNLLWSYHQCFRDLIIILLFLNESSNF